MDRKTRSMTLTALFTALCVIVLYLSAVSPTGQIGIVAFASVFAAAAIIECGPAAGAFVYIASSLIGALLLPVKGAFLLYIILFGHYPVVKHLIEKLNNKALCMILKLVVFNAAVAASWYFFRDMTFGGRRFGVFTISLAANAVFILYDYGYTKVIRFYVCVISEKIKRK